MYVLDVGVVWGCSSGDDGRATNSFRLALLDFGPPSHPHGQMISKLWLAVPGHDGTFTNTNLRSNESKNLELTSAGISPLHE